MVTSFIYLEAIASDDDSKPEYCTGHCISDKAEASIPRMKGKTDALLSHSYFCMPVPSH